ncbi:MAG TPA: hypothetical protein VHU86_03610 [Solirubrobacterales bacterium]|jgi:hypothetical protein|nr:hypothetical protein [Solirubrobacterales bacterium]
MHKREVLRWEARWSLPVAISTLLAVVALLGAGAVSGSVHGEGSAAVLRSLHDQHSATVLSGIIQAIGFGLIAVPLFYLFRAARERDSRVRSQLVGLVIVAPLFLSASTGLSIVARTEAANQFVAGKATSTLTAKEANEKCVSERKEKGAKSFGDEFEPSQGQTPLAACEDRKSQDDEADNALSDASLSAPTSYFGIVGALGLAIAFFYTCLWAMRTGLLGRFWASLGMALGVTVLIGFILFPMIWLAYFAFLVAGWIPGGKPPAWAAGEAVPWPTPGEKAAESLEPDPDFDQPDPDDPPALGNGDAPSSGEERRKRKQRD